MKRTPLKRRTRLNPVSKKRRAESVERRKVMHDTYGTHPRCALCAPLQAHGVATGCNGWADDADEILRRSAGGSITDPDNVRPVGRACHRWLTEHPRLAREWGLERRREQPLSVPARVRRWDEQMERQG